MRQFAIRGISLATIERLNRERVIPLDRYQADGAIDRFGYLENLAADHGVTFETILTLVDVLGPDEDFDGLVTTLEDYPLKGKACQWSGGEREMECEQFRSCESFIAHADRQRTLCLPGAPLPRLCHHG